MTELKLCPFCGGKAETFHIPDNDEEEMKLHPNWKWNYPNMWVVGCDDWDCLGYLGHYTMIFGTEESAIEAWNRRAVDD